MVSQTEANNIWMAERLLYSAVSSTFFQKFTTLTGQTIHEVYPETIAVNSLMLSSKPKLILGCKLQQEML